MICFSVVSGSSFFPFVWVFVVCVPLLEFNYGIMVYFPLREVPTLCLCLEFP